MTDSKNSKPPLRKVFFTHGFDLNGKKYGWYRGELYLIPEIVVRPGKRPDLKKVEIGKRGGFKTHAGTFSMEIMKAATRMVNWSFETSLPAEVLMPVFEGNKLVYGKKRKTKTP